MTQRKAAPWGLLVMALLFGTVIGMIAAQDFGTNWSATFFPSNNLTGAGSR